MSPSGFPYIVAVLDANVLYSAPLRDFFMRMAVEGLFAPRWTEDIHEEWMRALIERRPDLSPKRLRRTRRLMDRAVDDCLVSGYGHHIEELDLPDPGDRHVLAAAIEADAGYIVTANLEDFPSEPLDAYGIEAIRPDDFAHLLLEVDLEGVVEAARGQWRSLRNPLKSKVEFLAALRRAGLQRTADLLDPHL